MLFAIVGCDTSSRDNELLDRIEKLWAVSDSSVEDAVRGAALLEEDIQGCSDIMVGKKYDLLNIRLRDKLYIIPASDDSIRTVVDYFDEHGTISDKARAYYYMSSVYRDLHDSPQAITSGLRALDLCTSSDVKDSLLLMHIYSNLTALYRKQLNIEESIRMALHYLYIFPNDVWAMMDVASAYDEAKDSTNALRYYEKAYNSMMADTTVSTHWSNYTELMCRFTEYGIKDKAQSLYKRVCKIPEPERPSNYDFTIGVYHKDQNNVDSALYYFIHRYENADNWVSKCDAASQIMECYHMKGDYAKAADYAMKFRQANDSVIAERSFDLTRNAQAEYRYNRDREKEAQIKLDAMKMQRWLLIATIVFMMVIASGYIYYMRKRKRLEERIVKGNFRFSQLRKEMEEKETSISQIREELDKSNEMLDAKRIELTEVMMTMAEKRKEVLEMKESLGRSELAMAKLKEQLVETDNQIGKLQYELAGKSKMNKELIKELVCKELTELNTDILDIFDKSMSHRVKLSEVQWTGILANIDNQHPEFKTMLEERVPRLNVALLRTAYLMMAGLTNQQIESIMGVSRQTQWERAKKLEKYMGDVLPFRNS